MKKQLSFLIVLIIIFLIHTNTMPIFAETLEGENTFIKIATGATHSVALKSDGTVWTWGNNQYGQLGEGTNINRSVPVKVIGLDNVVSIAAGGDRTIALRNDGSIWVWGKDFYYKDIVENKVENNGATPLKIFEATPYNKVIEISAGDEHNLALRSDGTLLAWGKNNYGQLGKGNNDWASEEILPMEVKDLKDIKKISAGSHHCVALKNDGTVWAWGRNNLYQVGDNLPENVLTPTQINAIAEVKVIKAGGNSTGVIKNDGSIWFQGAYGIDLTSSKNIKTIKSFEKFDKLNDVSDFVLGQFGVLFLKTDGSVWSSNESFLSLFEDTNNIYLNSYSDPVKIESISDIVNISNGQIHYLALKADGTVFTWGDNTYGQLGNGKISITSNTSVVEGLPNIIDISSNMSISVAVSNDGSVFAWGALPRQENSSRKVFNYLSPIKIGGFEKIKQASAGSNCILALHQDGTVWGWGINSNGQLGTGNTTNSFVPAQVSGLKEIVSILTSYSGYSLALDSVGNVWEWGNGSILVPKKINDLNNIVDINISDGRGVALSEKGEVFDWVINGSNSIKKIEGLSDIKIISSGSEYTLAIKKDNTLWKYDVSIGMIYEVEGIERVISISASESRDVKKYISVLNSDTTVTDLKETDTRYQIGMYYANGLKRFPIKKLNGVKKLSNSGEHVLALKNDGSVVAWGRNIFGQLGNKAAPSTVLLPVQISSNYMELQIDNPFMIVNGVDREIDIGKGTKPLLEYGRTLVPIRSIIEVLGGTVDWYQESGKIVIDLNGKKIEMHIGNKETDTDSQKVSMDVPPQLVNGRTMIPLRFVVENLDKEVVWDQLNKKVLIFY